jgi:hypothetical protein
MVFKGVKLRWVGFAVVVAGLAFVQGSFYGADHGPAVPLFSRAPDIETCSARLVKSLHSTVPGSDVRSVVQFLRGGKHDYREGNLRLSQPFGAVRNELDGTMEWGADDYRLVLHVNRSATRSGGSCSIGKVTEFSK